MLFRSGRAPRWFSGVLLLVLLAGAAGHAGHTQPKKPTLPTVPRASRDQTLLVSLANGKLVALDRNTGRELWTFNSGAPLLTSTNPQARWGAAAPAPAHAALDGEDEDKPAQPPGSIFPGTDGSLYAYLPADGAVPRIERLPVRVAELVNRSPVSTLDGSLLLGSQHTSVFFVDGFTGRLVRTVYDFDGELGQLDADALGEQAGLDVELSSLIVIGRKDYVLRSVHPQYGLQWNVTWGQVQQLSELAVQPFGGTAAALDGVAEVLPAGGAAEALPADIRLLVGQDFSLRCVHPGDGWEQWLHRFEAPPLAAYLATGGTNLLAAVPPAVPQQSGGAIPPGALVPASGSGAGSAAGDAVVLVAQNGSLFGIPAEHLAFGTAAAPAPAPTLSSTGAPGRCEVPEAEQLARELALRQTHKGTAGALRVYEPPHQLAVAGAPAPAAALSQPDSAQCRPAGAAADAEGYCAASMLGVHAVHAVQQHSVGGMLLLPPAANESAAAASSQASQQQQQEAARKVSSWLVLLAGGALGAGVAVAALLVARSVRKRAPAANSTDPAAQHVANGDASSAATGQPLDPAAASSNGGTATKSSKRRGSGGRRQQQQQQGQLSNRMKGILDQAAQQHAEDGSDSLGGRSNGSDGASVNGTAHHAPFTAGQHAVADAPAEQQQQRESHHQQQDSGTERDDSLPSDAAVAAGLSNPAMRRRQMDGGVMVVGRMRIGPAVLGYGSGGTVVFAGELDGRPVAVKRMLRQFTDMARKEIGALILADEHPNIVRCFALEEDHEFVYLALERCTASLADMMQREATRSKFIGEDGAPTQYAHLVAADIARGVAALHERGIVHRDLKPQNVLLTEGGSAKLSDMGLSKRLVPQQVSFESVGSGGSSGWQAPEQLISRSGGAARQTNAVDVFSFGLLLHYCLTGGKHPFGESYERDANILQRRLNLKHLRGLSEAANLVRGCCEPQDPARRPPMASVMAHPVWWSGPQRLAFLIAVSDRVEGEDRAEDRSLYQALECCFADAVGPGGSWAAVLDSGLANNLGKYRKYSYRSLRDLLRVVRNKHNHFRELPSELQKKVGPIPNGFLAYFTARYPGLLMTCYYFALKWCSQEHVFQPYFPPEAAPLLGLMAPQSVLNPQLPPPENEAAVSGNFGSLGGSSRDSQQQLFGSADAARPSSAAGAAAAAGAASSPSRAFDGLLAADAALQAARQASAAASIAAAASATALAQLPPIPREDQFATSSSSERQQDGAAPPPTASAAGAQPAGAAGQAPDGRGSRPGSANGIQPQPLGGTAGGTTGSTGSGTVGGTASPLPSGVATPVSLGRTPGKGPRLSPALQVEPLLPDQDIAPVSVIQEQDGSIALFPRRPGHPVCDFYQKTGHCRFGETCKFDHPPDYAVKLNFKGLPLRPGQPVCGFYDKTGTCKFGPSCKFHHP